jgi:hypothetical protein
MMRSVGRGVLAILLMTASTGYAQVLPGAGQVSTPNSSVEKPGDVGKRAHTNIQIFTPKRSPAGTQPSPGRGAPLRSPQAQAQIGTAKSARPQ